MTLVTNQHSTSLPIDLCDGDLSIANPEDTGGTTVGLKTYGWGIMSLRPLWIGVPTRGTDILMPLANTLGRRREPTVRRISLELFVTGACFSDGTPYADDWDGLQKNIAYLSANAYAPLPRTVGNLAGHYLFTLTLPDVSTQTALGHVENFTEKTTRDGMAMALYTYEISLTDGKFA